MVPFVFLYTLYITLTLNICQGHKAKMYTLDDHIWKCTAVLMSDGHFKKQHTKGTPMYKNYWSDDLTC